MIELGVMVKRPDCPIDLEGLNSSKRALVMVNRPDCPIDLEGLNYFDRGAVIVHRLSKPTLNEPV